MKKDLQRLKLIRDTIIGIEMQLNLIENDLIEVSSSLDYLCKLESDLIFNINILKKDKIIAIASEYKKSIKELEIVSNNIVIYTKKKNNLKIIFYKNLKMYSGFQQEYGELLRILENTKVVLRFDQNKRRRK